MNPLPNWIRKGQSRSSKRRRTCQTKEWHHDDHGRAENGKNAQYADRVLLLDDAKLIAYDTPEAVFSREDLASLGVQPPAVTAIARHLNKRKANGYYPVVLDELKGLLAEVGDHHE